MNKTLRKNIFLIFVLSMVLFSIVPVIYGSDGPGPSPELPPSNLFFFLIVSLVIVCAVLVLIMIYQTES